MGWFSRLFGRSPERAAPAALRAMQKVVGKDRIAGMDGESVDDARDYENVVAKLAQISGGTLAYDHFQCTEDPDGRRLILRRGDRTFGGMLEGQTDWIDQQGLLAVLNDAVAGGPGRFVTFDAGYQDQGVWFAFLTREQADQLYGVVEIEGVKTLWKPQPRRPLPLFSHDAGESNVAELAASADGNLIASAGGNEVRVYDVRTGAVRVLAAPGATAVAFDPAGDVVIGTATGVKRGDVTLGARKVTHLAALGDRLVVGALDASITQWVEIWDLATNQLVREWTVSRGTIHVATAADAIATAGENEECVVWNLDGTKRFEHSMKGCVWGVALSRDGARVAFGTENGTIVVRSATDGAELQRFRTRTVWSLAFGPGGALATSGTGVTILAPERRTLTLPEKMSEIGNVLWLSGSSTAVATRKLSQRHNRIYQLD